MSTIIVFDVETTGLFDYKRPVGDPSQPHVVQLGAILYAGRRVVTELNVLVRPDGWEVPAEATAVHGISHEMGVRFGLGREMVLPMFMALCDEADMLVAHNMDFDARMVQRELSAIGCGKTAELFRERPWCCTMKRSTDILRLPGKFGKYKWPSLAEAHAHFLGRGFDGAHDAMVDVRACAAVYFAMEDRDELAPEVEL